MTYSQLKQAVKIRLEATKYHYSDIFVITAKSFGAEIKTNKSKNPKNLPPAGFEAFEAFLSGV